MADAREKAGPVKLATLEKLGASGQFTAEEQQAIASTIQDEIARLLPDLPEGIAEITAKAVGISIDVTEKLLGPKEPPQVDKQTEQ